MISGFLWNGFAARVSVRRAACRIVPLALLAILLAGCLQVERIVQVRPDGSGMLIERTVFGNDMVEMMAGMQPEGQTFNIRDDAKLRRNAANYGESVRFVSAEDVETDFGKGYVARYAFADIEQLRVNQDVGDAVPGDMAAAGGEEKKEARITTFTLQRGNPAQLVIHWPVKEAASGSKLAGTDSDDSSSSPSSPEEQEMALEMMRNTFRDMRMAIHVEVLGDIVDSNANYRDGSRVTLMDINFGDLFSDEAMMQAMAGAKPKSVSDMQEMMKMFPGLKMEINPEVTIRFQ